MLKINWLILLAASTIPLIIGSVWYSKIGFGNIWMKAADMNEDKTKGANMALIFGLTFLFSFFASIAINFMVIHQFHFYSILAGEPGINEAGTEVNNFFKDFLSKYGTNFRTFKHGVFHGTIGGFFLATPVIVINALFERKGFAYIAVNAGYWIVTLALMGGVICAFS